MESKGTIASDCKLKVYFYLKAGHCPLVSADMKYIWSPTDQLTRHALKYIQYSLKEVALF